MPQHLLKKHLQQSAKIGLLKIIPTCEHHIEFTYIHDHAHAIGTQGKKGKQIQRMCPYDQQSQNKTDPCIKR